jgi:putative transcriptional regulator
MGKEVSSMSNKLRDARKAAGFTQAQLAELAGIDRSTYVHIENGDRGPSHKAAMGIAKALRIPVEDLFLPTSVLIQHNNPTLQSA